MGVRGATDSDDVALSFKKDSTTTSGYVYYGEAVPGTATSRAGWRICRETSASGDVLYAGSGLFDQVWDNRASLTYS